jgi:hypothetical protein
VRVLINVAVALAFLVILPFNIGLFGAMTQVALYSWQGNLNDMVQFSSNHPTDAIRDILWFGLPLGVLSTVLMFAPIILLMMIETNTRALRHAERDASARRNPTL